MPRMVHVRELIEGAQYHRGNARLPIALGKNLEGEARGRGSGQDAAPPDRRRHGGGFRVKSVCIKTIITSLIYTHPARKLKLLMIDPKMVELSMYGPCRNLGLPVVTNHHKARACSSGQDGRWTGATAAARQPPRQHRGLQQEGRGKKPLQARADTGHQAGIQKELPLDARIHRGIFPTFVLIVDELAD